MEKLAIVVVVRAEDCMRFELVEQPAGSRLAEQVLVARSRPSLDLRFRAYGLSEGSTGGPFRPCQGDVREEDEGYRRVASSVFCEEGGGNIVSALFRRRFFPATEEEKARYL